VIETRERNDEWLFKKYVRPIGSNDRMFTYVQSPCILYWISKHREDEDGGDFSTLLLLKGGRGVECPLSSCRCMQQACMYTNKESRYRERVGEKEEMWRMEWGERDGGDMKRKRCQQFSQQQIMRTKITTTTTTRMTEYGNIRNAKNVICILLYGENVKGGRRCVVFLSPISVNI